jgi:triosephosphate isomerase
MMMRRKLVAGNWKMNGLLANLSEVSAMNDAAQSSDCDVLLCVPATLISALDDAAPDIIAGAQDCHQNVSGAHTGEVSAEMVCDAGAEYVILGHSERRADNSETDKCVREKTNAAWATGLKAIICVGETLDQRKSSNTLDIIGGQMAASIPDMATGENLVVAYEPIWAIGTGLTPSTDQIGEVHDFIRMRLERRFGEGVGRSVRILYGGSMNSKNVDEISAVSNVDGGLVGGASLKATDFIPIINALS